MDDLMGKLQEVLSDEDSMKMISELASSMFSEENQEEGEEEKSGSNEGLGFDIGNLMMLAQLMGSAENDKNAELLLALKPLLKEERRSRVDKAVKMLRLYSVWTILKDSGMLNEIL